MKTYILSILDNLKQINETLDAKAALYNKSWMVFNDIGVKEVFIFQQDGTLLDSVNGRVMKGSWQYIQENKTLLITVMGKSYMFHPLFMDGIVLALQMDGTKECCFMIDENNAATFLPKTLNALYEYFQKKKQIVLEAKQVASKYEEEQKKSDDEYKQNKQQIQKLLKSNKEYQCYLIKIDDWTKKERTLKLLAILIGIGMLGALITESIVLLYIFLAIECFVIVIISIYHFRISAIEKQVESIKNNVRHNYYKSKTFSE